MSGEVPHSAATDASQAADGRGMCIATAALSAFPQLAPGEPPAVNAGDRAHGTEPPSARDGRAANSVVAGVKRPKTQPSQEPGTHAPGFSPSTKRAQTAVSSNRVASVTPEAQLFAVGAGEASAVMAPPPPRSPRLNLGNTSVVGDGSAAAAAVSPRQGDRGKRKAKDPESSGLDGTSVATSSSSGIMGEISFGDISKMWVGGGDVAFSNEKVPESLADRLLPTRQWLSVSNTAESIEDIFEMDLNEPLPPAAGVAKEPTLPQHAPDLESSTMASASAGGDSGAAQRHYEGALVAEGAPSAPPQLDEAQRRAAPATHAMQVGAEVSTTEATPVRGRNVLDAFYICLANHAATQKHLYQAQETSGASRRVREEHLRRSREASWFYEQNIRPKEARLLELGAEYDRARADLESAKHAMRMPNKHDYFSASTADGGDLRNRDSHAAATGAEAGQSNVPATARIEVLIERIGRVNSVTKGFVSVKLMLAKDKKTFDALTAARKKAEDASAASRKIAKDAAQQLRATVYRVKAADPMWHRKIKASVKDASVNAQKYEQTGGENGHRESSGNPAGAEQMPAQFSFLPNNGGAAAGAGVSDSRGGGGGGGVRGGGGGTSGGNRIEGADAGEAMTKRKAGSLSRSQCSGDDTLAPEADGSERAKKTRRS